MKNKKTILGTLTLVFIALLVVVVTCTQAGINPENWRTKTFLSNVLIVCTICIFGIISGVGEGDNYYKTKPDGLFRNTYAAYNVQREIINPNIDKFADWNKQYYKKESHAKILRHLKIDFGIKQAEDILQLDRTEIAKLTSPQKFGDKYFKSLTQEQINEVYKVLDGKIKLKYVHESYFLHAFSKSKGKSMYEQAGTQEKDKQKKFSGLVLYRLILSIAIALVFAGLEISPSKQGNFQIIVDLFSRLLSLVSAVCWGFYISNELVKDECVFLDYKKQILETFYLDLVVNKTFVPLTEEEKAKIEFQEINGGLEENEQERILD